MDAEFAISWLVGVLSKLVLSSNAYITSEFFWRSSIKGTDVMTPNFVIVGVGNAANIDFASGAGTISCETEIGEEWKPALDIMIAWAGCTDGRKFDRPNVLHRFSRQTIWRLRESSSCSGSRDYLWL